MGSYQHVIWDWNGTLLNDVWLCVEVINKLLTARGKDSISHDQYLALFDFPVKGYYENVGFDFSSESFDAVCTEFCDEYEMRMSECELHREALNVLQLCKATGIPQSILSTTEQGRLNRMVRAFGISDFFERISGQTNHHAIGKADKGKELLASLGLREDRVVLVGDTTHDAQVASGLGIQCVLTSIGHHPADKLRSTGFPVLDRLSDFANVFNGERQSLGSAEQNR